MSVETIKNALRRIYEDKDEKIVIWYDEEGGFKDSFDELELDGIEKIEVANNSFWVKYRIYYEAPKNKYLIYVQGVKPTNRDNWLLDITLSYYVFKADESSMIIQELGLDLRLKPLIDKYISFFRNSKNKTSFSDLIEVHDDEQQILNKMMSVCIGVKIDSLEDILYLLFNDLVNEKDTKFSILLKYELSDEFYKRIEQYYGYVNEEASVMGLIIYLLNNRFKLCIKEDDFEGNKNANIFVNHWMQHIKYGATFKTLSKQLDTELQIKNIELQGKTLEQLTECDTYESIEQIIIQELAARLNDGSISTAQLSNMVDIRKGKYWYSDFEDYYDALYYASEFFFLRENVLIEVKSFEKGLDSYVSQLYKFDYNYRKYLYALSECTNAALFDNITKSIEKFYANNYLQTLSDEWYNRLPELKEWKFESAIDQKSFYKHHVAPQIQDNAKLCVIISDALRYESGKELNDRFNTETSIRTDFSYMVASLPSYTQLGMASLLPHNELSYKEGKFAVFADGMSTQGTDNRTKILQKKMPESIAIQASDFLSMKKLELRDFFKPYKLVYIYENSIDSRGKPPTEDQVFEATEESFDRIIRLTKKIHNDLQWRNVFVTADHGYLYEKTDVNESNFCKVPKDDSFSDSNKRMAIGNNLEVADCVVKYQASELNIQSDTEFLVAKSMQRIRSKGGGSKFVHGGATLQEVVIPLIKVNRNTDLKSHTVDFDVIRSSSIITSNIFLMTFLQKEPVGDKVLVQQIQVSLYSSNDELLSDVHEIYFDTNTENLDKMHKKVTFSFNRDMTSLNGQNVYLKVMTQAKGTKDFNKELRDKRETYTINISYGAEEW
jgi:uncharacterized protein (TIGR02687 family)